MILENGLILAYIGDAIYELKIREYIVSKYKSNVNEMHNKSINYTCAKSQAFVVDKIIDILDEEEQTYYKRGRNATSNHKPKSCSLIEYNKATGFESLLGYLYYIKNTKRIDEIVNISIDLINQKNGWI